MSPSWSEIEGKIILPAIFSSDRSECDPWSGISEKRGGGRAGGDPIKQYKTPLPPPFSARRQVSA
jgi:hypothetical protein